MALYIDPPLNQDPIVKGTQRWTLPWYQYFQKLQAGIATIINGINQLTGDVTAGPGTGSQVATIPNDTVTYAKMQNVSAASRLLGRGSAAGAGDVQEIALGSGVTMTGTTLSATGAGGTVTNTGTLTDHAVIVGNGGMDVSALSSLGTLGQVLISQGAGADPDWADVSGLGRWEPLANGIAASPELIFSNGDVIMVFVP